MSDTTKPNFDARLDAERLNAIARQMTYNDSVTEAQAKHTLFEVAMRLETGGYAAPVTFGELVTSEAVRGLVDKVRVAIDADRAGASADALRSAVQEVVAESLGEAYDCNRAWSAWQHGTMSDRDFVPVADQPDRIDEIAGAVMQVLPALVTKVHTWADMESISDEPKVHEALQAFSEDPTGDHGVFVVEAVLKALGLKTVSGEAVAQEGGAA